jgi:DNA gyrase/topoisomerase IV subunit B
MAEKTKHNYDGSKIETLCWLKHIRLRMGMYSGRIANSGHCDDQSGIS